MDGAEQECSGYILSLASGMLGLHFVLGIIPARPSFTLTRSLCGARLPAPAIPAAEGYGAKGCLGSFTELVLGGPGWCHVVATWSRVVTGGARGRDAVEIFPEPLLGSVAGSECGGDIELLLQSFVPRFQVVLVCGVICRL